MTVTDTEIREWARGEGIEVTPRGPVSAALRSQHATAMAEAGVFTIPDEPAAGPGAEEGKPQQGPAAPERPPQPPPQQQRRGGWFSRAPRKRGRPKARVSVENVVSFVWGGVAQLSASRFGQRYLPLSRVLAFQAPVIGSIADDAVKGTIMDRVLQPIARLAETGAEAGVVVALPLTVAYTCYNPEAYIWTRPVMLSLIKQEVVISAPHIKKIRERERVFAEQMAELGGDEVGASAEAILDDLFAPPPTPEQIKEMQEMMARAAANGTGAQPGAAPGAAPPGFQFFPGQGDGGPVVG